MRIRWITVCDKCLSASCWHGEFMCWESRSAGTVKKTESELDALHVEHPSNYSVEKVNRVCGSNEYTFVEHG